MKGLSIAVAKAAPKARPANITRTVPSTKPSANTTAKWAHAACCVLTATSDCMWVRTLIAIKVDVLGFEILCSRSRVSRQSVENRLQLLAHFARKFREPGTPGMGHGR